MTYRPQAKRDQTNVVLGKEIDEKLAEICKRTNTNATAFIRSCVEKEYDAMVGIAQSGNGVGMIVDNKIILNQYGINLLKEAMTGYADSTKLVTGEGNIEIVGHDSGRE